jgi:hypothetical protein
VGSKFNVLLSFSLSLSLSSHHYYNHSTQLSLIDRNNSGKTPQSLAEGSLFSSFFFSFSAAAVSTGLLMALQMVVWHARAILEGAGGRRQQISKMPVCRRKREGRGHGIGRELVGGGSCKTMHDFGIFSLCSILVIQRQRIFSFVLNIDCTESVKADSSKVFVCIQIKNQKNSLMIEKERLDEQHLRGYPECAVVRRRRRQPERLYRKTVGSQFCENVRSRTNTVDLAFTFDWSKLVAV